MGRSRGVGRNTIGPQSLEARHLGNSEKIFRVNNIVMSHRRNLKGRSETNVGYCKTLNFVQLPLNKARITKDQPNLDKNNSQTLCEAQYALEARYVLIPTVVLNLLRMELHRNAPVEGLGATVSQNLTPVTISMLVQYCRSEQP